MPEVIVAGPFEELELPDEQQLMLVEKAENGTLVTSNILPVRFSELEGDSDYEGVA